MDVLDVSEEREGPGIGIPAASSPGNTAGRVFAGIGGVAALGIAAVLTLGTALIAPIGMWLTAVVLHRRKKQVTLGASWFGAMAAVGITSLIIGGVFVARMPTGAISHARHAMDSASTVQSKQARPAWVDRLETPESRARSAVIQSQMQRSSTFTTGAMVVGGGFVLEFLAAFAGTLGWGAGLLLVYAFTGRWLK
jgi:hypothetical protein